jgi:hypothetical protein
MAMKESNLTLHVFTDGILANMTQVSDVAPGPLVIGTLDLWFWWWWPPLEFASYGGICVSKHILFCFHSVSDHLKSRSLAITVIHVLLLVCAYFWNVYKHCAASVWIKFSGILFEFEITRVWWMELKTVGQSGTITQLIYYYQFSNKVYT